MKVRYDRHEDILIIEVMPDGIIDHAEKVEGVIVHLTKDGQVVLLEILDASEFLSSIIKVTMQPAAEGVLQPA
jgi:uncharacterized protein YuzE